MMELRRFFDFKKNQSGLRKLGGGESSSELIARGSPFNLVFYTRIRGPMDPVILRKGLDLLQKRFPLLKTYTEKGPRGSFQLLEGDQKIPLRVIEGSDDQAWREIMEKELNVAIPRAPGPLLRVILNRLAGNDDLNEIIFVRDHVISDMRSGYLMIKHLLEFCERITSGDENPEAIPEKILPPVEALLPNSHQGARARLIQATTMSRNLFHEYVVRPRNLPIEKFAMPARRRTMLVSGGIEETEMNRLKERCRIEGTTVHGAIMAATLLAARERIGGKRKVPIRGVTFIDTRRFLSPLLSPDSFGFYSGSVIGLHSVAPNTPFWDLARDVKKDVDRQIKKGRMFATILTVPVGVKFMLKTRKYNSAAIGISNGGQLPIPDQYGPYRLEALHSSLSTNSIATGSMSVLSTVRGKLHWNMTASEPTMSRENLKSLLDRALAILKAQLQEPGKGGDIRC